MLALRVFLVLTISVVIRANIKFVDVDTGLYSHPTFENIVKESLKEVAEKMKGINDLTRATGSAINFIPEVGSVISSFLIRLAASETKTMWDDALIKSIADATQRAVASGKIDDMRAKINAIWQHFHNLKTVELTDGDKRTIVHGIHNMLLVMINAFTPMDSIFRKYPDLGLVPLTTLAEITVLFFPMLVDFVPSLASETILPCRLKDAIASYRSLHTYQRFQKLDGKHWDTDAGVFYCIDYDITHFQRNALVSTFDGSSYWFDSENEIKCLKIPKCFDWPSSPERYTVIDIFTGIIYAVDGEDKYGCIESYMYLLKNRIADAYNKPFDLLKKVCTEEKQNKRKPTGSGWLTIWVISAYGEYLEDGSKCDAVIGIKLSVCDLYVKFLVDGTEELRTTVEKNPDGSVWFKQTLTTKKISKNARITIQLMDKDDNDDDLLGTYSDNLEKFIGVQDYKFSSSKVTTISHWQDEYENEIQ